MIYRYRLCRKNGVWQTKLYNSLIGGTSLEGNVLAVDGEKVKLHLNIDETQNEAEASWFPYAPPTGNVMYSMPIVGTSARLYFPNEESEEPIVTGCVRTNGSSCAKTSDTTNRYFGTEHGSEIEMTPGSVNIKGGSKEPLSISFDDKVGVTLKSPKNLNLNSDADIIIKTPASVNVKAQSQIGVIKAGTENGLSVETDMHFKGSNVIKDGSDREASASFDDEPKAGTKPEPPAPPPPEEKKPFSWGALAKNVLAGLAVVALVTVAVVAVAVTCGAAAPVIGAIAVGAAVAGTAAVASQAASDISRGEVSDMSAYVSAGAREAFIGAVSGAIFGPFGVGEALGGKMLLGGATNAFESIVRQKLNGEDINWGTVLFDGGIGALTAGVFHGAGKLFESGSSFVKNAFSKVISKNESGLLNVAKKIDDLLAPVKVLQTPEGVNFITRESGTKAQDFVSKMVGKAKDNLEKDLLPAERAAKKGFSNIETTENGGPDFSKSDYIMKNKNGEPIIATIDMSGSRSKDFTRAFDDVNIPSDERKKILEDYTWHHVDDYDDATGKCTMQLVQKDAHVATYPHKGSCAQYDSIHGETYNKKYNGKTPKEKAADNGFEINETENGGADFSNTKYLYKTDSGQEAAVKIKMSGKRSEDTKMLFDNLGISKEEQKILLQENKVFYLDDFDPDTGECTIQIVDKNAYEVVKRYAGAQAQYKANIGAKYR